MRPRTVAAALALALVLAASAASAQGALVLWVPDGDTIRVSLAGKKEMVRILGVDAAETGHSKALSRRAGEHGRGTEAERTAGEAAAAFARLAMPQGAVVELSGDGGAPGRDRYGRLLAYVALPDGRDYGALIIGTGMARAYTRSNHGRAGQYRLLERRAREGSLGLWAVGGP